MKITVLQENLQQAIVDTQKSISSRPSLPILSCLLIQTEGKDTLVFSATDLSIGVRSRITAKVETEGKVAVPAKVFADYIATLDPGEVSLSLDQQTLTVKGTGSKATIQCFPAEDYPVFPEKEGQQFQFPAETFSSIVQKTTFAASMDEARPILTAVLFSFGEQLEVVGTDGFRLATIQLPQNNTTSDSDEKPTSQQLLMPAKALNEVIRIMSRKQAAQAVFTVSQKLKQIFFSFDGIDLLVRLMEGEYPPYQKIIPPDFSTQVVFSGNEFGQKLKTAMIFARESSGTIRLEITDQEMKIKSASSVLGTQESSLPIKLIQGSPIEIAFNAKYLSEFLQVLKPEEVWLGLNESLKPALFRPTDLPQYRYIVMPFRVTQ
jgi:DNA polymerase III subunit beta